MIRLRTKTQNKNQETGEFLDNGERSLDEVKTIIVQFPWEIQRENIVISLTNPSITIEGPNADFLKLGLSFGGKFVLHYFDRNQKLYKIFLSKPEQSFPYVEKLFESGKFDTNNFKKEPNVFQDYKQHFISRSFRYEVTGRVARKFLIQTTGFYFLVLVFVGIMLFSTSGLVTVQPIARIFLVLFIFLFGGGLNLIIFINYYFYSKNKILVMSKGNEIYYFGLKSGPEEYSKDEIDHVVIRNWDGKSTINAFSVFTIILKDSRKLVIPNIFIEENDFQKKLEGIPLKRKHAYPDINLAMKYD